jgi:ankyrin repeat protein
MLIRSSALIDAQDVDKVTPLAMASAHGQKNVVTALIKAGAYAAVCRLSSFHFDISSQVPI